MTNNKYPIEEFSKLDLRVGQIKKVEKHSNADKLLILTVNLNEESPRTIIAGLAQHYSPSDLKNKKAIFITNLAPVKLRGIESNGMILAASNSDKTKVSILQCDQDLEIGSKVY